MTPLPEVGSTPMFLAMDEVAKEFGALDKDINASKGPYITKRGKKAKIKLLKRIRQNVQIKQGSD